MSKNIKVEQVEKIIREKPNLTSVEIAGILKVNNPSVVRQMVKKMRNNGIPVQASLEDGCYGYFIEPSGYKQYLLADKARLVARIMTNHAKQRYVFERRHPDVDELPHNIHERINIEIKKIQKEESKSNAKNRQTVSKKH